MQNRTPTRPVIPAFTPVPRRQRHDGWTPERQRAFIDALAQTGSVRAAARQVNMASEGAYQLRLAKGADSFRAAWEAALDHGIQRIEDNALDRALNGVEVPICSGGQIIGTRIVHNERLVMFVLRNRRPDRYGVELGARRVTKEQEAALRRKWEGERERPDDEHVIARVRAEMARIKERLSTPLPEYPRPADPSPPPPPSPPPSPPPPDEDARAQAGSEPGSPPHGRDPTPEPPSPEPEPEPPRGPRIRIIGPPDDRPYLPPWLR